jgi:drug/metabolite transporter (DMT)-like permease
VWAALQKVLMRRGHRPQSLNLLTYGVAAVVFLPLADGSTLAGLGFGGWVLLVFLGVNTLLAYGAMGEALQDAPANQVSIIITLNPLLTLALLALMRALDVTWIDPEPVSATGYLGAACMLAGVILVVRRRAAARA